MAQHEGDDVLLRCLIQTGKRLVKHDKVAWERHRARQRNAPAHTAGKLHGRLAQAVRRQNLGQQRSHVGPPCIGRQHQRHVLHRRQGFTQAVFLEHHADATRGNTANLSGVGVFEAQQHPEQRGFTATRGRHQAAHAATRQRERDAPQHLVGTVRLAHAIELNVRQHLICGAQPRIAAANHACKHAFTHGHARARRPLLPGQPHVTRLVSR